MKQPVERKLAAILAADVAGYSRLMGADEAGTAQALRDHRAATDPLIAEHGGRIVKTTGDGVLIEFGSVVGAVQCAIGLQKLAAERNAGSPDERRMEWRIGIHLGDVLVEGDDILGDGVNIAARLEGISEPGGICISEDGSLEDVFELQDRVAVSVAGVIEPALQAAEMRRSAARPTTDLTAYDLYLRALAAFYPITQEGLVEALRLLEQAIAIDPRYGPALSWAAICQLYFVRDGWTEEPETSRRKANDFARQALKVAQNDPGILANAAFVLAYFGEDIGAMIGLIDRALALNPSFARGWHWSGVLRLFAGQPDLAIEHLETALRLSPRERMGQSLSLMGM